MAATRRSTTKTFSLIFLFTFLVSLSLSSSSSSSSTDSFVFGRCSQQKYSPDSAYESNVNSLLISLVNSATYSSYNSCTIMGSSPQDVVYGLYQCRGDLAMPDCATCVAQAVTQLGSLCPENCGGALQLPGCYVKYDNTIFLYVEDNGVVWKKCGPSVGYDAEVMSRRDAVLSGLVGTGGIYRVGGSGEFQGLAQCVGDLNFGECQDCLSQAIGLLESDCRTADYGDMFLGKCYARYSTGGADSSYKPHNHKSSKRGEKTFTITVGLSVGASAGASAVLATTLVTYFRNFIRKLFKKIFKGPGETGQCETQCDMHIVLDETERCRIM